MDKVSKETRSRIMSSIRGKDTKPELLLRKMLWSKGLRYRKNYKAVAGTPDIAFPKYKLAIFVDGEFWHGYNWKILKKSIGTNREYWIPKIERNRSRDREVDKELKSKGWNVIRFWSKNVLKNPEYYAEKIIQILKKVQKF